MGQMTRTSDFPLTLFRAYLLSERGLSASSAESYVKQVRRMLRAVRNVETCTRELLCKYDETLSVKMRENWRAACRHYVVFMAKLGYEFPSPPTRIARVPTLECGEVKKVRKKRESSPPAAVPQNSAIAPVVSVAKSPASDVRNENPESAYGEVQPASHRPAEPGVIFEVPRKPL